MNLDMDMGKGVPTLAYMQKMYWAYVGAAIACTVLMNVIYKLTLVQRLYAAKKRHDDPAKPSQILPLTIATITAISREITYATLPAGILRRVHLKLPSLGPTLLALAQVILVIILCVYKLNAEDQWSWEKLGYRTGAIAAVQLPLIFILSSKNNILGFFTGFSYDKLNWLHRWCARVLLLTATIHMSFWFRSWARYDYIMIKLTEESLPQTGFASWCILLWIVLSSFAPLRRLSYEFFVIQHVVSVAGFCGAVYLHLPNTLKYVLWISLSFAFFDRIVRFCRVLYCNISIFHPRGKRSDSLWASKATLEPLSGGFTRLTINKPPISWKPGQHVFLSCHSIVPLQSHPFTISSLPGDEKMQFLIKSRSGGTKRFWKHAEKAQTLLTDANSIKTKKSVAIEGPYGKTRPLQQFDSVIFLAGGVGSTFTVPLMRNLVQLWNKMHGTPQSPPLKNCTATKYIRFVWVIKNRDQISWFSDELTKAAETVATLREEGVEIELHASIYITCDETLSISDEKRPQPTQNQRIPLDFNVLDEKSENAQVTIESVRDSVQAVPPETQACGPYGKCCCTTTIEDEPSSADEIRQCTCNCSAPDSAPPSPRTSLSKSSSNLSFSKPPVTGSSSIAEPSNSLLHPYITILSGRPHPRTLIRKSLEQAGGESAVVVCGPEGLVEDVSMSVVALSDERAVHKGTGAQGIYLHREVFCY